MRGAGREGQVNVPPRAGAGQPPTGRAMWHKTSPYWAQTGCRCRYYYFSHWTPHLHTAWKFLKIETRRVHLTTVLLISFLGRYKNLSKLLHEIMVGIHSTVQITSSTFHSFCVTDPLIISTYSPTLNTFYIFIAVPNTQEVGWTVSLNVNKTLSVRFWLANEGRIGQQELVTFERAADFKSNCRGRRSRFFAKQ